MLGVGRRDPELRQTAFAGGLWHSGGAALHRPEAAESGALVGPGRVGERELRVRKST